jgi:hypothetical protein
MRVGVRAIINKLLQFGDVSIFPVKKSPVENMRPTLRAPGRRAHLK